MNVVVEYLAVETMEGEPKTTFQNGPYGYQNFIWQCIIQFFMEGGKPKVNITGDFVFLPESDDIGIAD